MRRMLEVSIGRSKLLGVAIGICRQVSICRCFLGWSRGDNAVGDRQAFGVAPGDLPEFVRRTPERAEALGALAQAGLVVGDSNRDNVVVTAPGVAFVRFPLHGVDAQFDGGMAPARLRIVEVTNADEPSAGVDPSTGHARGVEAGYARGPERVTIRPDTRGAAMNERARPEAVGTSLENSPLFMPFSMNRAFKKSPRLLARMTKLRYLTRIPRKIRC